MIYLNSIDVIARINADFLSTGLSRNLNRDSDIFIQKYSFENPVYKMADILSGLMLTRWGLNKTANLLQQCI